MNRVKRILLQVVQIGIFGVAIAYVWAYFNLVLFLYTFSTTP